jgi:hypothetical protein
VLFHSCSGFADLSIHSGACGRSRTFCYQNGGDFHSPIEWKSFCFEWVKKMFHSGLAKTRSVVF